jgi:hypothetical protein
MFLSDLPLFPCVQTFSPHSSRPPPSETFSSSDTLSQPFVSRIWSFLTVPYIAPVSYRHRLAPSQPQATAFPCRHEVPATTHVGGACRLHRHRLAPSQPQATVKAYPFPGESHQLSNGCRHSRAAFPCRHEVLATTHADGACRLHCEVQLVPDIHLDNFCPLSYQVFS